MSLFKASMDLKISEAKVYRENIILNFIFTLFPLLITIFLWKTVYKAKGLTIGGYTLNKMMTYFLFVFFLEFISNARVVAVNISSIIRDGTISSYLLKPIGFYRYQFTMFFTEKTVYFFNILIPLIIFIAVLRNYLYFDFFKIILFIFSCFLALVLNFTVYLILGILTIWFEEITAFLNLWSNLTFILSGGAFPLTIVPERFYIFLSFLPFKYMVFTPINIYIGNLNGVAVFKEISVQIVWILALYFLFKILWKKGREKFSGYGI